MIIIIIYLMNKEIIIWIIFSLKELQLIGLQNWIVDYKSLVFWGFWWLCIQWKLSFEENFLSSHLFSMTWRFWIFDKKLS